MRPAGVQRAAVGVVLAIGMINLAEAAYLPTKAWLAQVLLHRAWQRGERAPDIDTQALKPWPWADTYPVARLTTDASDDEVFILSGGSGRTLAFGPGHLQATVLPGEVGNSVIAGHRDSHFSFLQNLKIGDALIIDRRDGERIVFDITSLDIVDSRDATLRLDADGAVMTLVTCYPFNAVRPGGSKRYVVTAHRR
ncbi:MAG: class GN sortase [Pseudomonadota bacterium]